MATDSELVARLREFLGTADLTTTTTTSVRRQLEDEFSVDLSCRKEFLREQIRLFLSNDVPERENDAVEEEIGEEEVKEELENVKTEDGEDEIGSAEEDEVKNNKEKLDSKKKDLKRKGGGFCKPCALSPKLQEFAGEAELARTEVVKKIWAYIREKNLQNPSNKRKIICDEKLYALFQVKSIDMFKMNKALSKHIWPIEDYDEESGVEVEAEEDPEEEVEEDDAKDAKEKLDNKDKGLKKKGGGFGKPCALSPKLQEIVGEPELARTEVVKKIWAYIHEKNLQNPNDKRKIICDEKLYALFQVKSTDMFKMNKALSKHIWPIEDYAISVKSSEKKSQGKRRKEEAISVKSSEKESQGKRRKEEGLDDPKLNAKRKKVAGSGFLTPLLLSDALVKFFGTGESALSRSDVVKRLWQYIKDNNLQDPSDKRKIICDEKLKELFDVDTFIGFTVSKLLTAHFIKKE